MDWKLVDPTTIRHTDGFEIILDAGSWIEPYSVVPKFPDSLALTEVARHIREGIACGAELERSVTPIRKPA